MRAELRRSIFLACVGLLAGFALVVTLYGAGTFFKRGLEAPMGASPPDGRPAPLTGTPGPGDAAPPAEQGARPGEGAPPPGKPRASLEAPQAPGQVPSPGRSPDQAGSLDRAGSPDRPKGPDQGPARSSAAPTFDIIRIEPSGEAVIAGRATPNTTVELLRDGGTIARALVDPSGQFAIVPPALPAGNSEITLRVTGADGQVHVSRDSVAVVVAANRLAKPLIALTSPDKPTIVLSQPDTASPATPDGGRLATTMPGGDGKATAGSGASGKSADGKSAGGKSADGKSSDGKSGAAGTPLPPSRQAEAPRPNGPAEAAKPAPGSGEGAEATAPVKIVSVEAEEGGRLYVTSQAQPGATVRLYLNDTLVAPGSAGADGRVAFTIGRGVRPGDYKIRVDQVDPVSGKVRTRSEVPFTVPPAVMRPVAKAPPEMAALAPGAITPMPPARSGPAPLARPGTPENPASLPPAALPKPPAALPMPPAAAPADAARAEAGSRTGAKPDNRSDIQKSDAAKSDAAKSDMPAPAAGQASGSAPADPAAEETRTVFVPEIGTARIIRGDSLWQISRRIYGKGTRYTVIYDANQPQIRNPDLIYPGQIFVLPSDGTAAAPQDGSRG